MCYPAKDLFCRFQGNHSLMEKSGVYDYYKSFSITKEEETKWLRENEREQINDLSSSQSVKTDFRLLLPLFSFPLLNMKVH